MMTELNVNRSFLSQSFSFGPYAVNRVGDADRDSVACLLAGLLLDARATPQR